MAAISNSVSIAMLAALSIASGVGIYSFRKASREAEVSETSDIEASEATASQIELARTRTESFVLDPLGSASEFVKLLHSGSSSDLLGVLKALVAQRKAPRALAEIYQQEIVSELVARGAWGEVLAIRGGSDEQRDVLLGSLFAAVGDRDPDSLGPALLALPTRNRQIALVAALKAMAKSNPGLGLKLLAQNPDSREAGGTFFQAWAESDPQTALVAAQAFVRENPSSPALHFALGEWAKTDRVQTWNWIESQPSDKRSDLAASYLSGLLRSSPQVALAEVVAKPELQSSWRLNDLGQMLAKTPEEADRILDELPVGSVRKSIIVGIASSLSREPEQALAWADTLLPGERSAALQKIFQQLSYRDVDAGLGLAMKLDSKDEKLEALNALASRLASNGLDSAVQKLSDTLDPALFEQVIPQLFSDHYGDVGFQSMLGAIPEGLAPKIRNQILVNIGETTGIADPSLLRKTLETMPPDDRDAYVSGLITRSHLYDQATLREFAGYLTPEAQAQNATVLVRQLALSDPAAAAAFALQLPDNTEGGRKVDALRYMVEDWAFVEPDKAAIFVLQMPGGPGRDSASEGLSRSLRKFDLPAATRVLGSLEDPKKRMRMVDELAQQWSTHDPAQGRAIISPLTRTPEERQKLEEVLARK